MSHHPQPNSAKLLLWLPMTGVFILMMVMYFGGSSTGFY